METAYNLRVIRDLLLVVFNDQDLSLFCRTSFQPVYDHFAFGMGRLLKIHLLIDYCQQHQQLNTLLAHIERLHPDQYKKFVSALKTRAQISTMTTSVTFVQPDIESLKTLKKLHFYN